MQSVEYKAKLTFTEPLLGSSPGNPELLEDYISSKAPTLAAAKEELEAAMVPGEIEKATTIFPRDEHGVFLWDYQIRGSFKEALAVLVELGETTTPGKWMVKKAVDCLLFVSPRRCYLLDEFGKKITGKLPTRQRSLRATTMQGDRIAIASSEQVPPGTFIEFNVKLLIANGKSKKGAESSMKIQEETIEACIAYNASRGFGQWRSGGFGRFGYELKKL